MSAPMRIGILETGRPPEELAGDFGDYPTMIKNWLAPLNATYDSYAVLDGTLPADPRTNDIWVIGGSRFAVYQNDAWIARLEQFVRDCAANSRKMIGICFGHQIIAQALGGKVVKFDRGWGLGVHRYATTNWPDALGSDPSHLAFQAFHQDQVVELPTEARRIARSDFCENAALWYPGFALTVQGHPEFSAPYVVALLKGRRGTVLPADVTDQGLSQANEPTTKRELAELIRDRLEKI